MNCGFGLCSVFFSLTPVDDSDKRNSISFLQCAEHEVDTSPVNIKLIRLCFGHNFTKCSTMYLMFKKCSPFSSVEPKMPILFFRELLKDYFIVHEL